MAAIQSKMLPPAQLLVLSLLSYFKTLLCFPLSNSYVLCRICESFKALCWLTSSEDLNGELQTRKTHQLGPMAHKSWPSDRSGFLPTVKLEVHLVRRELTHCVGSDIKSHRREAAGVHANIHADVCPLLLRWALMSYLTLKWSI